jgi:hypothetical protein
MLDPEQNPVRKKPLYVQRDHFNIDNKIRLIRHNLVTRKNKAQLYICGYTKKTSNANKKLRVKYGDKNKDKPVLGFWDLVYFTDEAYYNPDESF